MAPKRRLRKPPLEVLSQTDGAWYDGDVSIDGPSLRVHFSGFGSEVDEFWDGACLKNPMKIREIVRLRSKQLQDWQCTKVMVDMIVCANFKSQDDKESKYYDAKVLAIYHNLHTFHRNGKKESCNCQFKLAWESGPLKHEEVCLGCADISFIDNEGVEKHPVVHQVLQAAHVCAQDSMNFQDNVTDRKLGEITPVEDDLVQPVEVPPVEDAQVQLQQILSLEEVQHEQVLSLEDVQELLEQVLPVEDVQVQPEQVFPTEDVQVQPEHNLPIHDVQVHYVDTLFNDTPSEERNEDLFTSFDMDRLPEDMIRKVKNHNIFHEFLGEQADKLKEALDMFNSRNNFNFTE